MAGPTSSSPDGGPTPCITTSARAGSRTSRSRAGLGGDRDWPTSAAWADLDNDGDLDLYVCHYLKWDAANPPLCGKSDQPETGHSYCDPRTFPALPDHVFRNDGGRFVDVTEEAGIVDRDGRGLGVVAADLDGDGKVDLFVANDTTANYFFRNRGGFRFAEKGEESGLAASATGGYLAGMGVACGDLDGDGRIDLAVTNFFGESTTLYHNHGGGIFSDRSTGSRPRRADSLQCSASGWPRSTPTTTAGSTWPRPTATSTDYRPSLPSRCTRSSSSATARAGSSTSRTAPGRPGRSSGWVAAWPSATWTTTAALDVLLVAQNAPLALFRNRVRRSSGPFPDAGAGGDRSNRDGVGAQVTVTASGRTVVAARFGGGSYLSASDPRLHFGLGAAPEVDRVEVIWPSGRRDRYEGLAADAGYRLREGDPTPIPWPASATSVIVGRQSAGVTRRDRPGISPPALDFDGRSSPVSTATAIPFNESVEPTAESDPVAALPDDNRAIRGAWWPPASSPKTTVST